MLFLGKYGIFDDCGFDVSEDPEDVVVVKAVLVVLVVVVIVVVVLVVLVVVVRIVVVLVVGFDVSEGSGGLSKQFLIILIWFMH